MERLAIQEGMGNRLRSSTSTTIRMEFPLPSLDDGSDIFPLCSPQGYGPPPPQGGYGYQQPPPPQQPYGYSQVR
jgi:hypothetical protein